MSEPRVLFAEPGGRWRSVAFGPLFCLAGAVIEFALGVPVHWLAWVATAPLLAAATALHVLGARRHGAVELSTDRLRQGTEVLQVSDIELVFDEPGERAWDDPLFAWETSRALGESFSVPRQHTGVGLELTDGRLAQAWARDDSGLREALEEVLRR